MYDYSGRDSAAGMEMELGLETQVESAMGKEEHESCGRLIHYQEGREIGESFQSHVITAQTY